MVGSGVGGWCRRQWPERRMVIGGGEVDYWWW